MTLIKQKINELNKNKRKRVVLFASIEPEQHNALRYIAYKEKRSLADVTREAIGQYIKEKTTEYPMGELEAIVHAPLTGAP